MLSLRFVLGLAAGVALDYVSSSILTTWPVFCASLLFAGATFSYLLESVDLAGFTLGIIFGNFFFHICNSISPRFVTVLFCLVAPVVIFLLSSLLAIWLTDPRRVAANMAVTQSFTRDIARFLFNLVVFIRDPSPKSLLSIFVNHSELIFGKSNMDELDRLFAYFVITKTGYRGLAPQSGEPPSDGINSFKSF
jgi:hypothetical protein